MTEKKRIVILGAGFGGIYAYLGLKKYLSDFKSVEIVLIDKKNYFLFVPMIHEVATGNLSADSVIQPIRQAIDAGKIKFIEGEVKEVNLDSQEVKVPFRPSERSKRVEKSLTDVSNYPDKLGDSSASGKSDLPSLGMTELNIKYDYLVCALGSVNNFFDVPGAEHSLVLKELSDAQAIRRRIITAFETASLEPDHNKRAKMLNFVVIGGGPTGVELAAEIADLLNNEIKKAFPQYHNEARVHIVHAAEKLMGQVDGWFHEKSAGILRSMGVVLHLNHRVTQISEKGACFDNTEWIESDNVFWTAGVRAAQLDFTGEKAALIKYNEREGRIGVAPTLQIPAIKNIFVVGDQMCLRDQGTGQPYPMRAQFAAREGLTAGYNVAQLVKADLSFRPSERSKRVEKSPAHAGSGTPARRTDRSPETPPFDKLSSSLSDEAARPQSRWQGKIARDDIKLKEFEWHDQGFIVSLGKGGALAQIKGLNFSGPLAWWLYRTAYLFKLVGTRAKLKTAYEWTINLFLPRDISKF